MPVLNPYASSLGDRDPVAVIGETAGRLARIAASLGSDRLERTPAPGKWSAREIFCHLADCDVVFAFRLRQTLADDQPVLQPFDQDRWARSYRAYTADMALAAFSGLRAWNVALVASADPAAFARTVTHPERGTMTFRTIVETMAGHDLHHLAQLDRL